jgi:hypothetical protein
MPDQRALAAIDRIERALARIEASAQPGGSEGDGEFERLRAAHDALRGRVQGAIAQIDRLIDNAEAR